MTGFTPFAAQLTKVADTPPGGFALQNGTPTIWSWTAPNDGQNHRVSLAAELHVTSLETGGVVTWQTVLPDSTVSNPQALAGGLAAGVTVSSVSDRIVGPGTTVSLVQSSALTAGAALLWAQLWAD